MGFSNFHRSFLAYQPDSHYFYGAHPEFNDLYARFIQGNLLNNSGDIPRLWSILLNCKQVVEEGIPGDFAELGVWRGNTAAILSVVARGSGRQVFLFDTFEGFQDRDLKGIDSDKKMEFRDTSTDLVLMTIGEPHGHCHLVKGYFPNSVEDAHRNNFYAVVSLDCDLYEPMKAGLDFFYARMPKGATFLLHDYSSLYWKGAKLAIDEFCAASGEFLVLIPDKSGSAFIRKTKAPQPS